MAREGEDPGQTRPVLEEEEEEEEAAPPWPCCWPACCWPACRPVSAAGRWDGGCQPPLPPPRHTLGRAGWGWGHGVAPFLPSLGLGWPGPCPELFLGQGGGAVPGPAGRTGWFRCPKGAAGSRPRRERPRLGAGNRHGGRALAPRPHGVWELGICFWGPKPSLCLRGLKRALSNRALVSVSESYTGVLLFHEPQQVTILMGKIRLVATDIKVLRVRILVWFLVVSHTDPVLLHNKSRNKVHTT